ncbi:MAG: hypothetical protein V1668_03065 [Patescibacteria group bacterium]
MDTASHGAWGALVVRKAGLVGWAVLTGALPDIIPALYELVRHPRKYIRGLVSKSLGDNPSDAYLHIYHWAHSLLPISFVTIIVSIFTPTGWMLAAPYYLHIFLDIFTHRGRWATRIFYPVSDFHFEGFDWWRYNWISIANWATIAVVGVFIFTIA